MDIQFTTSISGDDLTEEVIRGYREAVCLGTYRPAAGGYAVAGGFATPFRGERVEGFSVTCRAGGRVVDLTDFLKEAVAAAIMNRMVSAGRRIAAEHPAPGLAA